MSLLGTLLDMLTFCRPYGSRTEQAFIERFIAPLPGATRDNWGNWHIRIGDTPIIWSCHTDTVHHHDGRQTISYDPQTTAITLSKRSRRHGRNCLGADDSAGVFICQQMILAGIPGHYIFHTGEEVGGIGSSCLVRDGAELVADASIAIAFDRRGVGDVITHQWGSRCASDRFVASLSDALHAVDAGLCYLPARGSYTDTAEYTGIVSECTNLSIGYFHEHSPNETLMTFHTLQLLRALCMMDQSRLETERPLDPVSCIDWSDWGTDPQLYYDGFSYRQPQDPPSLALSRDCYLDPIQADIQRALRRDTLHWHTGRRI